MPAYYASSSVELGEMISDTARQNGRVGGGHDCRGSFVLTSPNALELSDYWDTRMDEACACVRACVRACVYVRV